MGAARADVRAGGHGTFENDDGTLTPAPAAEVAACRHLARTIRRDTILRGLLGSVLALATTLVR